MRRTRSKTVKAVTKFKPRPRWNGTPKQPEPVRKEKPKIVQILATDDKFGGMLVALGSDGSIWRQGGPSAGAFWERVRDVPFHEKFEDDDIRTFRLDE